MADRRYPIAVQRMLDVLPPAAQAAALAQLPFARGLDDQLTVVSDAWLRCALGDDADGAARWMASSRRREGLDMRRAGHAVDIMDDAAPSGLGKSQWVEDDPLACLLAAEAVQIYQAGLLAAGIVVDAAPSTIGTGQGLATADVAQLAHRGLRAVQTRMRRTCRAELDGQGVLPGMPAAAEVYRARALGAAA